MAATAAVVVVVVVLVVVVTSSGSSGSALGRMTLVDRLIAPDGPLYGAAVSPDGPTVYLTGSTGLGQGEPGELDAIDVATDQVRTVAEGVGNLPLSVAVSPDGRVAYVTDHYGDALTPVDLASRRVQPRIRLGMEPTTVAIGGHGSTAYVVSTSGHTVVPVNLETRVAEPAITVAGPGPRPEPSTISAHASIAVSHDGATVYVTVPDRDIVVPIDVATNKEGTPLAAGQAPQGIAITPDGKTAYVTNTAAPRVSVTEANTVTPIDLRTGRPSRPMKVDLAGLGPIAIASSGQLALVGAAGDVLLTSVDLAKNRTLKQLRLGVNALSIGLTRAGTRAYIVTPTQVDVVQVTR